MKRKSPIRHKVRAHKRDGAKVKSYTRGSGEKSQRRSKVVGKASPLTMFKWTHTNPGKREEFGVVWKRGWARIFRYHEGLGEQAVDEKGHPIKTAYILDIEVYEPGRGHGRKLYEEIERGLRDRGFERIVVDSSGADEFWEAMGFDYSFGRRGEITGRMSKNLKEIPGIHVPVGRRLVGEVEHKAMRITGANEWVRILQEEGYKVRIIENPPDSKFRYTIRGVKRRKR